jgi:hypothetical protein
MIHTVNRRFRPLVVAFVATLAFVAGPSPARAGDEQWFTPSGQPPSAPASPPATGGPQSAPPPMGVPEGPPPPLAPSPLLQDGASATGEVDDRNPEALTKFRPYLDPYGTWHDDPTYGRVWIPNPSVVGPNFQPYVTNGRWAVDDGGEWIWVSDYSFGWVVFHYGRWVWIQNSGWAWIPGNRYAPAWVTWRVPTGSYDYVGWAPAPPTFVWYAGVSFWWGYDPYYWWVFCPSPYLFHYHVGYYVVTDPYWQGYAARYTTPYVPANPTPRNGSPTAAAPRPRNPSLSEARVPPSALSQGRASSPSAYSSSRRTLLNSPSEAARPQTRADVPTRSHDVRPSRSTPSFRDVRPSTSQRVAPVRNTMRSSPRPDMRVSPRAVRPSRR